MRKCKGAQAENSRATKAASQMHVCMFLRPLEDTGIKRIGGSVDIIVEIINVSQV